MTRAFLGFALVLLGTTGAWAQGQGQGQGGGAGAGRGGRPGAPLGGFARDQADQPVGTGVIKGRILAADTGAPIRRAQVRATSGGGRGHLTSTDADGRFELTGLTGGRWELSASKAGFVTLRYGQRRPFEAGRPIELADKQVLDRIEFALPRGGAITGHVLDEFGDAVAGARVQVMRYQIVQGSRRLTPVGGGDQTDDTGAFRAFGLMPGEYYVSATLRTLPVDDPDDALSYAPTYFPGTGNVAEAQRVTVGLGDEQNGINFALLPVKTVRVTGQALDSSGAPLANGMIALNPADSSAPVVAGPFAGNARTRNDGTFTIANVVPGSYILNAMNGGPGGRLAAVGFAAGGANADMEIALLPITVGSEDLTGVVVVTGTGGTLSGTVSAAQGSTGKPPTSGIQINSQALQPERPIFARPARVEADGTFRMTNLFGPRQIRVGGLPQNWTLKSILVGGVDVTDNPVDFKSGQEIKDAQIVLTDRVTEITGKAAAADGVPARDYTVVIFPEDQTKWTGTSRYIRSARPDQQGLFKVRSLPPAAAYLAVAVDYLEDGEANDPEFLDEMKARATKFTLADGDSRTIDLKLITR
jgi:hypothetical protein